ncbi:hypothetical protein EHS25_000982 [Saitozyma podzolica]|uniref:Xylanolytic transcriptional activator regulatory domain-containing protein n=1 Tax=Saitozyma podzolica TaxID=1890683 RepID=A0A427YH72_9TREE|nr:hypothetical protein EHS25_000982 [Saitozyma podzolica]
MPIPNATTISNNELFLLASTASQDEDPLSFLNLDVPLPGIYDWNFGDSDLNFFEPLNTNVGNGAEPDFGASSWFDTNAGMGLTNGVTLVPNKTPGDPGTGGTESESIHGQPHEIPDGQPDDSPWPHIYKPKTPDANVNLPTVFSSAAPPLVPPDDQILETARNTMITLVEHSHHGIWPSVEIGNFPSVQILTTCANLYHRHFHDWMPILNKEVFRMDQAPPMLLMGMAAIGSMYSRDGTQKLGSPLNELVRRGVLFIRENDRRFMFETNLIQASLLQSYYGMFCGSQKLFQQSESNRGMLITACKRMHLLRPGLSAVDEVKKRTPFPAPLDLERAVAEDDRRRRLGWGIYLLDTQLACLLNLPAQLSLTDIAAPLPTAGPEPTTPSSQPIESPASASSANPLLFSRVLEALLSEGRLSQPLSDLGYSIVAHTLYRLCLDAAAVQSLFSTPPSPSRYGLAFPPNIKHHPQALLDQLASHTFHSAASPTSLLLSCAALAYHAHLQFARVGFLERVKIAAGKSGTAASREAARVTLSEWINSDVVAARNIFAHAAMLRCLLWRFTFDTPPEVVWTFDAALCMWAVLRFSNNPIAMTGMPGPVVSWSESAAVDEWVKLGGGLIVQGLGNIGGLSISSLLQGFADRLDVLSWGLASQYRKVLLSLIQEST